MQGPDEFYPPYQYGWGWLVLALAIVLVLVLAWGAALWFTRQRKPTRQAPAPAPAVTADALTLLRHEYAVLIEQIEAAYRAGAIDAKAANRELSRAVRHFVNEYSGLEAPVMTLTDMIARGVHPALIDAVQRHYYPSLFRRDSMVDPSVGAQAARTVVATWY